MKPDRCEGFNVLPTDYCYPVKWPESQLLVEEKHLSEVMNRSSRSIMVHFFNKLTKDKVLYTNGSTAYVVLAKKYCPKSIELSGETF